MDILTEVTKNIGNILAKIKNNNQLVDELNKLYNPTFVEIIESLLEDDKTLAQMLMIWYTDKYSVDHSRLNAMFEKIKNEYNTPVKPKRKINKASNRVPYYLTPSDCGVSSGCDSSSGYSSRSWKGCGSSSYDDHC